MTPTPQTVKSETPANEEVARLLERAQKGDHAVLPALQKLLDESPALWKGYGDLASQAQARLIMLAGGDNLLLCESLLRKATDLKAELVGGSPSPMEGLLADQVVACWLQVSYYDGLVAQNKQCTPAQAKLLQHQQDGAHRRYLAAMKTMATVRKLLTPARSPVEIATRLGGEKSGVRLREAPVEAGAPVMN